MFSFKNIFSHYWQGAKDHKVLCILSFFVYGVAIVLSSIVLPLFYRDIIDVVTSVDSPDQAKDSLFAIIKLIAGTIIIANILFRIGDFVLIRFQSRTMRDLSNYVFKILEKHSYSFFSNEFVGSITAKVRRFVHAFEHMLDTGMFRFFFSFLQILGVLVVMFFVAPPIGWVFLFWFFTYILVVALRVRLQIKYNLEESSVDSRVNARLADVMSNILAVKMFSAEKIEDDFYRQKTKEQEGKRMRSWSFAITSMAIQGFLLGVLEIVAIWLAVTLWLEGEISTGTIVLVQSYILVLIGGLLSIGQRIIGFFQDLTRAQEMVDILDLKEGVKNPKNPKKLKITCGKIDFNNVSFKYDDENDYVLKNFSLTINSGEKVGLVGPSGAGKSTITKILLRFIDISKGSVKIDGQDIREITQQDLRSSIAYVPQDALMFHRTIKENIAYGKPEASKEEIIKAAKRAKIHDFIDQLPNKYETMVGERGVKLSGGEKQRIAIARAILKDVPLLVLDEATSSLDTISEIAIKEALNELMKGKTTLVIAHRLSTVKGMDRILVLRYGEVVEQGTHKELLNLEDGLYASLWSHQSDD